MSDFPIIILHGWGAQASRWDKVKSLLEQKGFQVYVPDLPGFGKEPEPPTAWGLDEYAQWVVRWAQAQGVERFVLIGHSFGGSVAVKIAVSFPEKVARLVLVNSAGIRTSHSSLKMRLWLLIVCLGRWVFNLPVLKDYQELIRKVLYKVLGSVDYFQAQGIKKESLKKIFREDIRSDLARVRVPTLIIWAEKDKQTSPKWAQIFQQGIAGSQLKMVSEANHVFPYYESERFVRLIEDFL